MNYNNYLLNDFITDDFFQEWVKNPDFESNIFWQKWIAQNPEKKEIIEEARQLILFFSSNISKPSLEDFSEVKKNIFSQIYQNEEHSQKDPQK